MDDATRAELAKLRRRAFGPDPDIAGDPAAMDRLVALEALVLAEHAAAFAALHPAPATAGVGPAARVAGFGPDDADFDVLSTHIAREVDSIPPSSSPDDATPSVWMPDDGEGMPRALSRLRRRLREGGGAALAAAATAFLIVAATAVAPAQPGDVLVVEETTRQAWSLARDADARVVMQIPLVGALGPGVEPAADEIPPFPTSGEVRWAVSLGDYYGWELWIAGARGALQDEQCILVVRDDEAKGRCVVASLRGQSALAVSIPASAVSPQERPTDLRPGMRLGFWWTSAPVVRILVAAEAEDR